MEAGSENSKAENSLKEKIDEGIEKAEVEEVDFVEVIELSPETVTKQDEPVAVEVTQAEEKKIVDDKEVEKLSVVYEQEGPVKELVSSEYERKQDESCALPISDANVVESSGVADSISKVPIAVPPGDAANGGGDRDLSENPSSTENQPAAVLTPHTRTSWANCCGLFDVLRRSDQ